MKFLHDAENQIMKYQWLPQLQPSDDIIWAWIAALVLSVQITVWYACQGVHSLMTKLQNHDALIIKEPLLVESCSLTYAVSSSFSPVFVSYIGINPKIKGYVHGVGVVKEFLNYLMATKPEVPFHQPLSEMFHSVKICQSKIGIDWFVNQRSSDSQQCYQEESKNKIKMEISEIFKLREVCTLCEQIGKVQHKFLRTKEAGDEGANNMIQYMDLDEKSKAALDLLGTNGIHKSDIYFFSTCLAVLTRFVYELVKFPNGSKDRSVGRRVLAKYLAKALKENSMFEGRERLRNVLSSLIKGEAPLFSPQFVATVLQGSSMLTDKTEKTRILPPFSIPNDEVWKVYFPDDCKEHLLLPFKEEATKQIDKQPKQGGCDTYAELEQRQRKNVNMNASSLRSNEHFQMISKPVLMQKEDDLAMDVLKQKDIHLQDAFATAVTKQDENQNEKAEDNMQLLKTYFIPDADENELIGKKKMRIDPGKKESVQTLSVMTKEAQSKQNLKKKDADEGRKERQFFN